MATSINLDDLDKRIIHELQVDGRMPFSQLGPLVGLSDAAVRQRYNRLVAAGVVSVVAIVDAFELGFGYQCTLGINVDGNSLDVAAELDVIHEVDYVIVTAGRYNLLAEAVCADAEHLLQVLTRIQQIDTVKGVEVHPYLRLYKQKFNWGDPPDTSHGTQPAKSPTSSTSRGPKR